MTRPRPARRKPKIEDEDKNEDEDERTPSILLTKEFWSFIIRYSDFTSCAFELCLQRHFVFFEFPLCSRQGTENFGRVARHTVFKRHRTTFSFFGCVLLVQRDACLFGPGADFDFRHRMNALLGPAWKINFFLQPWQAAGVIGVGGHGGDAKRGEAAVRIEGVGEFVAS